MRIHAIKTPLIRGGDALLPLLYDYLPPLQEGDVLAITSKIISVSLEYTVPKNKVTKEDLIYDQAEAYLKGDDQDSYNSRLTLKHHMIVPAAGIDESNTEGDDYIIFPPHPFKILEALYHDLRAYYAVQKFGLIMTDSHTTPLRRGVTGISLAWWGFKPHVSQINKPDLFNRPLKTTTINVVDALAASAVLTMGEGNEQTPLALIQGAPHMDFDEDNEASRADFFVEPDLDVYKYLLKNPNWVWKKD